MGYVPLSEKEAEHLESLLASVPGYHELSDSEKNDLIAVLTGTAKIGTFLSEKAEAVATEFMKSY